MSTQRRLTSLEADLAAAERREVEKKNGAKYHKVCPSTQEQVLTVFIRSSSLVSQTSLLKGRHPADTLQNVKSLSD